MTFPDFSFEKKIYKKGYRVIAGMDEVGRGSFAGPVVAGCVVFSDYGGNRGPVSHQPQIHPQGDPGFGAPRCSPPLKQPTEPRFCNSTC